MAFTVKHDDLPQYTAQDYALWEGDWELIGGIPYAMTPSPVIDHQSMAARLIAAMVTALEDCPLCRVVPECDWHLDESTIVRPDVSVICHVESTDFITSPPAVIVEVLSPTTESRDRGMKRELYEAAGVRHYVLADVRRVELVHFQHDGERYAEPVALSEGALEFDGIPCAFSIDVDTVLTPFRR